MPSIVDIDPRILKHFAQASFVANRHLLQQLRRLGLACEQDLDAAFVWLTVELASDGSRGLRTAEVARQTGLPRETVRRKLHALAQSQRLARSESGLWQSGAKGSELFGDGFRADAVERLLATAAQLQHLLAQAPARVV